MVSWRPIVAILSIVLGGVFLVVGILPLISCFAAGERATCEFGSALVPLVLGSALFGLGNYLVYREYGVIPGQFDNRGGGPPGRYR
jgi:hypothetical protein